MVCGDGFRLPPPTSIETTGRAFNFVKCEADGQYDDRSAEVAELVDAPDSKSGGVYAPCGFKSHLRHPLASLAGEPSRAAKPRSELAARR